ncbi:hypothetical protein [Sphingomonas sp. UNC305MFCol5.2]|uniref:hypothetical protein n=1 Tax=Sphingomonas sp. UNC305MFCol5.2 TaxID=1449076 RepID=UPI00040A7871|nr:hypothetical protein [Sphingomonas sp. UNC305MFCol5.2]
MSAANTILPALSVAIAQARKRIVAYFLAQHAISPEDAVPFVPAAGVEHGQFQRMLDKGVVHEATPGSYWLDRAAYRADDDARRRVLEPLVIVLSVVAAGLILLGYRG